MKSQDDPNNCGHCGGKLATTQKAEYPGAMSWPYCYCSNPKCPMYKKEQ